MAALLFQPISQAGMYSLDASGALSKQSFRCLPLPPPISFLFLLPALLPPPPRPPGITPASTPTRPPVPPLPPAL
eukprot:755667-Hanusia_phi.AAC.1